MDTKTKSLLTKLAKILKQKDNTIAIAESCTGGGVAHTFTLLPSSSSILECAIVTYSDESKNDLLNIPLRMIKKHGAVSPEVTIRMARHALQQSRATIGVAITGLAGPDKDDTSKVPIGTVYIAFIHKKQHKLIKKKFKGNRQSIIKQSITAVLQGLLTF